MLAPAREFLKTAFLGISIFLFALAQVGKIDFLDTTHFYKENGTYTQKYANNATKLNRKWFSNP